MSPGDESRQSEAKADRWQRVGALFDRAVATPPPERASLVRSSTEPSDVQDEVLALLKSHDDSPGFLEPPALLTAGTHVGAYRIDRILGRGGMGVVYLAHDTRLHRAVALKALPPHLFRDDRMRARLRQEARAAAALSHPSIATVFALEEIGDQIFIASEYLEGRTLRAELNAAPLSTARAIDIARTIAHALLAAHDRGIVHRDLKPENIIITPSGGVKILDFGLAQFDVAAQDLASATRLTDPGVVAGTPPYMAPEQLLAQPTSARTDQFAFGVLLYEMLTGRHPFGSGGLPTTIAKTLAAYPDKPEIDGELWSVISRTLEKNPDDRFPSTKDLVAALAGEFADKNLRPDKNPLPDRTPRPDTTPLPAVSEAINWWMTHQLIVALAYWFMVWPAWQVHKWTGRYGVLTFLATLAIVVVGANVRLHLWFTARTYPGELPSQVANIHHLVRVADVAFSLTMIATGLVIADTHTGWSALFVSFGLGAALAFLVIEPATARAAFNRSEIRDPRSEIE
ncbi:MAG TPA: serine/threonine-protein kinase [Vicinamibacterales bacterium]|nr:serine/threonine-protein kinase [Vicinamibacterales bacterium]